MGDPLSRNTKQPGQQVKATLFPKIARGYAPGSELRSRNIFVPAPNGKMKKTSFSCVKLEEKQET
jgi:hypothetical protein